MRCHRALALFCFLSAVLCACHAGMRPRVDASGSTVDLGGVAPSEDAPPAGPARDAHIPDEAELADSSATDTQIPYTVIGDAASGDTGLPFEVARIVRDGTNFGTVTVVVYSDASAVRIREESKKIMTSIDAARERTIETLPSGTPEVVKFLQDLGPVDRIAALGGNDVLCIGQSVSFSTRTHLTVGGRSSRNLECSDGATASDPVLTADCLALAK